MPCESISLPPPVFSPEDFPDCEEISIEPGRWLLFEGEPHKGYCYLILEGEIEVGLVTAGGHETVLYRLSSGDLVGELGLFGQHTRTATILAATPCRLLQISPQRFIDRFADEGFRLRIMSLFLQRYLRSHEVIRRLGQPTIAAKLCRYLLDRPEWREHQGEILTLPTHQELAKMLSCQRETITRTFRQLQQLNVLERVGEHRYRINRQAAQSLLDSI